VAAGPMFFLKRKSLAGPAFLEAEPPTHGSRPSARARPTEGDAARGRGERRWSDGAPAVRAEPGGRVINATQYRDGQSPGDGIPH
jgi:hypothetical protein